ncbi:MAG: radical SAM protein, partial [Deltaproteobacteria bacterium]|nr:radical SAM protein [Deltaproteobacteria bacterium]
MVDLIFSDRKGAVLTHPSIPCLMPFHTMNLTAGCLFSCRYCYAQSFRNYPGKGTVVFYANTFQALAEQLPRKRKAPDMVFFSSACDPFAPFPQTLDCLHDCMSLLLKAGSRILISTKGIIPTRFIELFAQHHERVYVEIGLTTVDDDIRQLLEPGAPSVPERLRLLQELGVSGVSREVRMIPLIPELTDDEDRFEHMVAAVSRCGVTRGSMAYLFLRPGHLEGMECRYGE